METGGNQKVQLYSNALTDFCKDNKLYIDLLKDHVEELDRLKQYDRQLRESKTENDIYRLSKAADPRNLSVMFAQMGPADKQLFKTAAKAGEYEDVLTSHRQTENPFCYLCTTIEQHKKHIMKTEKRIHGKKRIPYEAPPPFVPPKPPPSEPESKDCLFKVTVKTGVDIEAACSAPVFIALHGKDGRLKKARLVKKFGSLGFFFDSGSTEVFHLRGPLIGKLERLVLTLEQSPNQAPDERHQKWLVESVKVKDYSLGLEYNFVINKWLRHGVSKRSGERRDQVKLLPTSTAKSALNSSGRGLQVVVHTARKATSGTDCRVFISFMGTSEGSGKARHELRQPSDVERIFQPNSKDNFELHVDDFGDLKGIRLEIDPINIRPPEKSDKKLSSKSSTVSKSWFVDQVIVKDIRTGQKWLFTISDWLNEDTPMKEFWTVKDVEDTLKSIYTQKTVYEIVTKTGKKDFAGTDSTIYLSLFDKENRRCDIELRDDKDKSKFEKGQTDRIRETSRVIDTPERIRVSISGKGVAPDWQMEGIEVTKYLVTEEILQYLQRLQFSNKMPVGLTQDKGKILFGRADDKQKKLPSDRISSSERASRDTKISKKVAASGKDSVDGDILGKRIANRSAANRRSLAKPKVTVDDSEDTDESTNSDASEDSVKSHDDFDPERGMVRLPYAVKMTFAPRNDKDTWVTKDKTVELKASAPGELIFSDLRLRCDNESFERFRKELLEKQRADEEKKKKKMRENKLKQQQQQKKPGSRSSSRSRGNGVASSDLSDSSDDQGRKKRRVLANSKTPARTLNSTKKTQPLKRRESSSSSDSSTAPFGKSKGTKLGDKKPATRVDSSENKSRATSAAASEEQKRGLAAKTDGSAPARSQKTATGSVQDSKRGMDHVDFDKDHDKAGRLQNGLDRGFDKGRVGQPELTKGLDRRSPRDFDKSRGLDLERDRARSPFEAHRLDRNRSGHLDFDKGRGFDKDLDSGRGRMDSEKGVTRSPRDLDGSKGRFEPDKRHERSGLDLGSERGRLDSEKALTRSPRDLNKDKGRFELDRGAIDPDRGRLDSARGKSPLDLDKGRGFDKDLDRGKGRFDSEKGLNRSPRDLDSGKGRFQPNKGPDRSAPDLDRGNFDRRQQDRTPLDLDRGRSGNLDLDRGRSGNLDLDRGRSGNLDLDRGRSGNLNLDRGRSGNLDLDRGRSGNLDLDRSRSGNLDLDRSRSGNLDLDRGRSGDLDKNRAQFDLNRNRGGRSSPLDKPQIVVTGSDGRNTDPGSAKAVGRVKPRFNVD